MAKSQVGPADKVLYGGAMRKVPGLESRAGTLDQFPFVVDCGLALDLATTGVQASGTATVTSDGLYNWPQSQATGLLAQRRQRLMPFPAYIASIRVGWVSGTVAPTATWAAKIKVGTTANASKFGVHALVATDFIAAGNVVGFGTGDLFDQTIDADEVVQFVTTADATVAKQVAVSMVCFARDPGTTS